jgi:hypothetical protein
MLLCMVSSPEQDFECRDFLKMIWGLPYKDFSIFLVFLPQGDFALKQWDGTAVPAVRRLNLKVLSSEN